MRKKKQEMLKTQIECQKVRTTLTFPFFKSCLNPFFSCLLHFLLMLVRLLPGFDKPPGEEPRDET